MASHVNEQLCADLPGNRFITAWLGVLEVESATLTAFSAGQAPLLYYRADDGEVEVTTADAPPFGLLPGLPVVVPASRSMRPGDIQAVLSDGFFEATDPAGLEFGTERVGELIRRYRNATAEEILTALVAALREFTGDAPAEDDRTAVLFKRRDGGESPWRSG